MQKIRTIFTSILTFIFFFSFTYPVIANISWVDKYDYSEYYNKINVSSYEDSFSYAQSFDSIRTTYMLQFEGYAPENPESVEVEWKVNGKSYHRHLDWDNEAGVGNMTFPFVSEPRKDIAFTVSFSGKTRPAGITLITSNQSSVGKKMVFGIGEKLAHADTALKIVRRAEWGADETLRYVPTWKREQAKQEWEERGRTPRIIEETLSEREKRMAGDIQYNALISLDDDANSVVRLTRFEGDNKLIFPIRTAKKINRIFIHHTAEGLEQDADDATLIRAIYLYHAKSKGWGDIGYNYIVGQRGVVYEGRAGGDYVEGAHVYANNLGTVGISVIGNYQYLHLNRDQREGLVNAITYVAKKYGITVDEESPGIQSCNGKEDCYWKNATTHRLAGHRDAGSTSCPGDNIYTLLPEIRNEVVGKVGKVKPVYNTENPKRDSIDPEDTVQVVLRSETKEISSYSTSVKNSIQSSKSYGGKSIKILLSYPSDTLTFESATDTKAVVRLNAKILPFGKNVIGNVFLSGSSEIIFQVGNKKYHGKTLTVSSDVIRIPSWNRVPTWDSSKRYNDNMFRGKLYISNQGGKLLVVNELPIEDYLRGLGEVSDSDHSEKIKTIIVAARSYAYFYRIRENRKYGTILYDGSDNPDEFQKYLGYGYELRSPNVASLVENTKGQVITYNEKLIKPWYFSSSDGKTLSYKTYCQLNNPGKKCEDIPYLQSVDDPAGDGKVRNGHGVGISGIGSTYAANKGKNYKQIIAYYLKGTLIRNINTLK